MENDKRGFLRTQDCAEYKSFGGFNFGTTDKAKRYNKSMKYDFLEEAEKIKNRFKTGEQHDSSL